jgi:hypothetical protein
MAERIKGRAVHRCGELLRELKPANGTRADLAYRDNNLGCGAPEVVSAGAKIPH